ncbi:MAG TPA: 30S ribosomal protein THX [Saprospiraceae bacterium]|nr:30S ribosomal protein THX [Saprospiraceae bacterium]
MGKGDRRTKKGKIIKGSYGVSRPKKKNKPTVTEKK